MPREPTRWTWFIFSSAIFYSGNLPLSEANGMVGAGASPQLAVHSEGEQHSGPSLLPGVGWSDDEEHRWQAQ